MGGLRSRLKRFVGHTSEEQKTSDTIEIGDTVGHIVDRGNKENDTAILNTTDEVAQLSLGDTSSSLPEVNNTHVTIHDQIQGSLSLWDLAYDSLREENRDLIVAYESILSRASVSAGKDASSTTDFESQENQIPQSDAIARREMMIKITELGLKHMEDKDVSVNVLGHNIGFKNTMANVAGVVDWAEDYVKAAVKDLPYASIVMAGVSLILPLLKNPVAVETANREGFTYVTSQMRCYVEMESLRLPADMEIGLKSSLTDGVTDLYKLIIEFQVESVVRFYRARTKNYFRDTVNYDDWAQKLSQIKETEFSLDKMFERVISGESLQQLKTLAREAKDSRDSLAEMIGKFDQLIDISQDQKKIMERNEQRLSREDNRRCQEALQATDPVLDKERILLRKDQLLRDSYCWVLENNDFQEWRNDIADQLLWLTGDPGKGKTMLVCGIIDELSKAREIRQDENICYFFCQATDDRINSAVAVLRGLIYMLVREQPSLMKHLRESCEDNRDGRFKGPNAWVALSKVFVDMLGDSELRDTYLIVDALDECRTDLDLLLEFFMKKSPAYSKVKWIVSSRNWPKIEKGLKLAQKRRLCIELNAESVSGAVDSYIQIKISWLAERNDYDEETRKAVQQYLLANAKGTFLWVALVCKELADISGWEAEELLTVFPPGLDDLYRRMLEQIRTSRHFSLCKDILAVILFVHRPITLDELTSLVKMPSRVSRNLKALEEIVGLCGSFLTLQKHTVSFVHQSAKDFLLEKASTEILPDGAKDLNHRLFSMSLQIMEKTLKRDIYSLGNPGFRIGDVKQPDPDPLGPARYACIFWMDHLQESDPIERAKDDFHEGGIIDRFLRQDFLHWIESLCLLQALSEGVTSMLSLETLVQGMVGSSPLSDRVRDACQFIRYYKGLIESYPLQVYASALIFSPVNSITRKQYAQEEPAWFLEKPQMEDNWGSCIQTLEGHALRVSSVCWSPDGSRIASASPRGGFKIWDPVTGQCIATPVDRNFDVRSCESHSVIWSNDTPMGFGVRDDTIQVWDLMTGNCMSMMDDYEIQESPKKEGSNISKYLATAVSLSQHGSRIAASARDGSIYIWCLTTCQRISELSGHTDRSGSLAWSPDGRLLASASCDRKVKIWDTITNQCLSTINDHGARVNQVSWSQDGALLASGSANGTILIWDLKEGQIIERLHGRANWIDSLNWSRDGSRLASASSEYINVWDMTTYQCISTLSGHSSAVESVAWSQNGAWLASGSNDQTIKIWDSNFTQKNFPTFEGHKKSVKRLVLSPDETKLASASADMHIKIWDLATGKCDATIGGDKRPVLSLDWSPNGTHIASASNNGLVKIWNTQSYECDSILGYRGDHANVVAWSPDNTLIAAGFQGPITVWDSKTSECIFKIRDERPYYALEWSQDGSRIASLSVALDIKVWDTARQNCLASFSNPGVLDNFGSFMLYRFRARLRTLLEIKDYDPETHGALPIPNNVGFDLDPACRWITYSGEPFLRLPTEYQPGEAAIGKNFIGIGCHSGRVLLLRFSGVNPLT